MKVWKAPYLIEAIQLSSLNIDWIQIGFNSIQITYSILGIGPARKFVFLPRRHVIIRIFSCRILQIVLAYEFGWSISCFNSAEYSINHQMIRHTNHGIKRHTFYASTICNPHLIPVLQACVIWKSLSVTSTFWPLAYPVRCNATHAHAHAQAYNYTLYICDKNEPPNGFWNYLRDIWT